MIVASLSLMLFPDKSNALEPISTLISIIGGPIFCKMIGCKTHESKILFAENPSKNRRRLNEIKNNFMWDDYYQEGDCMNYHHPNLDEKGTVCYTNGKWVIVK